MPMFGPEELRAAVMRKLSEGGTQDPQPAAVPEKKGIGIAPYVALAGGSIADAASTIAALKRPGTMEANPLLRGGAPEMLAVKGAGTAAVMWLMHKFAEQGHPTAAKAIGYGGGALFGGMGVRNMGVGK